MWLYSEDGFLSAVCEKGTDRIMVRARRRKDIDALGTLVEVPVQIVETPKNDYPYRFFVTRDEFAGILARLVADMTYTNFKSGVHGRYPSDVLWGVYTATEKMDDRKA